MLDGDGGGGGYGLMNADPATLRSAATEAGTTATSLDTTLTNLMNNLAPLVSAWQGDGGAAFQNIQVAVNDEIANLNRALMFLSEQVDLSSSDYVVADEEIADDLITAGATDSSIGRLLTE